MGEASKWMQTANETDLTDEIERQPLPTKIKTKETSEEDEKRQAEQAIEQQEAEKNTEDNKEDERGTQITPTPVPATSGNQSAPIQMGEEKSIKPRYKEA